MHEVMSHHFIWISQQLVFACLAEYTLSPTDLLVKQQLVDGRFEEHKEVSSWIPRFYLCYQNCKLRSGHRVTVTYDT